MSIKTKRQLFELDWLGLNISVDLRFFELKSLIQSTKDGLSGYLESAIPFRTSSIHASKLFFDSKNHISEISVRLQVRSNQSGAKLQGLCPNHHGNIRKKGYNL